MNTTLVRYTDDFLSAMREQTDTAADDLLERCFSSEEGKLVLRHFLTDLNDNEQLLKLPELLQNESLLCNAAQLPEWANLKQMQTGAAFFARYAALIMNMLGLLSLPYCYAAADGAKVLYHSERLRNDVGKRLRETGEFVWQVMSPDAFAPEGQGFATIIKVRMMHAMARYYTLKSSHWQAAWGQPVNQEDMAGTNLSFSLLVIRGLRKLDIAVSYADQQAFMHLWNVIGHLLGVDQKLLPVDGQQAIDLEQTISCRQIKPSEEGRALTKSLTDYITGANLTKGRIGAKETVQLMRFLMGDEIADVIDLPAGRVPASAINLLKLAGMFQEFKVVPSVNNEYRQQYSQFKKQHAGL
ncbi:oxygenase MpaB family protein [Mucilaginibacter sp. CSA2-8R]|uniref:oxygenase MpaB family protein n=1 Tax=Mucilaginibacter sp. CSA2-8R TaxID=3141542 RepID=UPI00315C6C12